MCLVLLLRITCSCVCAELNIPALATALAEHRKVIAGQVRKPILKHFWPLVDREAAKEEIRGSVAGAITRFKTPLEGGSRFEISPVVLALNMPGIGKTWMLYELRDQLEARLREQFGERVVDVLDLIFTFNIDRFNQLQPVEQDFDSINAVLGWRALRHFFAPNVTVIEFYTRYVIPDVACPQQLNVCACPGLPRKPLLAR